MGRGTGYNRRVDGALAACPIEGGCQHAVAVLMAVRAHGTGRGQIYDPEKREIREG